MAPVDMLEQNTQALVSDHLDGQLDEDLDEGELLIEEISIDGMCGVY